MITVATRLLCVAMYAALVTVPAWSAQITSASPAPVPSAVLAAKRVFLSNLGHDIGAMTAYKIMKVTPGTEFDEFYAALKTWRHYELTDSPSDADAVFAFSVESGAVVGAGVTSLMLRLQILDTKTGFVLWTITTSPVVLGRNLNDELAASMPELINSLKGLAPPATEGTVR
jgi:hypothetical protein